MAIRTDYSDFAGSATCGRPHIDLPQQIAYSNHDSTGVCGSGRTPSVGPSANQRNHAT